MMEPLRRRTRDARRTAKRIYVRGRWGGDSIAGPACLQDVGDGRPERCTRIPKGVIQVLVHRAEPVARSQSKDVGNEFGVMRDREVVIRERLESDGIATRLGDERRNLLDRYEVVGSVLRGVIEDRRQRRWACGWAHGHVPSRTQGATRLTPEIAGSTRTGTAKRVL